MRTKLTLVIALLIALWSFSTVTGAHPYQDEISLIITQSGENLIFGGDTMANAHVTVQVWLGLDNCWGTIPITLNTQASAGGTYRISVLRVPNSRFPAGSYSAYALSVLVTPGPAVSMAETGCIYFSITYPVPELSEVHLLMILVTTITIVTVRRRLRSAD